MSSNISGMSGLINSSLNNSASNIQDASGRSYVSPFPGQSGTPSSSFHHTGAFQGFHNFHGIFNLPNVSGSLASRNSSLGNIPSGGIQQPSGGLAGGRFASNNVPIGVSQLSHGSHHGHSGLSNRGNLNVVGNSGMNNNAAGVTGSLPGILPNSVSMGNRNALPGFGVPSILGNAGPRLTNSIGSMVGSSTGRNVNIGGGLSIPALSSRMNLNVSGTSGTLVGGQNRFLSGVPSQGSQQVISLLGNSYPSASPHLSQNHAQAMSSLNSMGVISDSNSTENSPFDINNDFPQLASRPNSAGGHQGQMGSLRKQGVGVSPIVQQNQEFSIQNEDFPALPGFKGANTNCALDLQQKEQLHDNSLSLMQSQHYMGRTGGFGPGNFSSYCPPQPHVPTASGGTPLSSSVNQDMHSSELFSNSHSPYHPMVSGPHGIGHRTTGLPDNVSGIGSYDQFVQHYQQKPYQSQFRLQQFTPSNQPFREQSSKTSQSTSAPDPFGLLGLLSVLRMSDPDLTSLALGIDLTTLGLNLNSPENLHRTFSSPWSDEPSKVDPEFKLPQCYYAKQPPVLHQGYFPKFSDKTLFYIFYSMPKDEAQLYAASELYNRGWFFHRELRLWLMRVLNMEPLVKTNTYERACYHCFDPNTFSAVRKDNFVLHYEMVEKRPILPQH